MRIDIGSGPAPKRGYLSVDAYAEADIKAVMWDLPFKDGEVTEIWSSHSLEHVPFERVQPTLREWVRVLSRRGRATISVPNFDYAARYWLSHQGEPWALAIVFGNQKHEGEFHKTGWSPATFKAALEEAGFRVMRLNVINDHHQETIRAVVARP